MSQYTTIAIDAMGGDNAPQEIVKGAVDAVNLKKELKLILLGTEELIQKELKKYQFNKEQVEVIHTSEVIKTAESPVVAIKSKKDSSLVVGMKLVKDGKADGIISAGNSGAILVGGQVLIGRIKGIQRPALAPLIPTKDGMSLLIDCGANVDARSSHLVQFAQMGSIYMEHIMGVKSPKVGIANIGAEEEKGNALVKETFPLLRECPNINFVGSVESRDIPHGAVDVVVCEAFTGNCILKTYEGVGTVLIDKIKTGITADFRSKIGAWLIKPALKKTLKVFDMSAYGGAPLLGLRGLVVKAHGSSNAQEITNSIMQCIEFKEQDISGKIEKGIL
ncbi:MAG: phosphate acyltransferase PlsX [Eubacteriales bacterium]